MASGVQRAGDRLPASFVARLTERLDACDQPLIQLWSWPWSGKRRLLQALVAQRPGDWLRLPSGGALAGRVPTAGGSWLIADGHYRGADLLAAAERLRPEQRLVLAIERRRDDEILPRCLLDPREMLLRPAEVAEMFAGAGDAWIAEVVRLSDGWAGPLDWLREHRAGGASAEEALSSAGFAARFHQRVTDRLDPEVLEALIECSVADEVDPRLWRRVWARRPERLAAFERLLWEWGWAISEPGGKPRLPRLLRRATRPRRPSPERRRDIFRQLGLAAHGLGLAAEAERFLDLAGDDARLARLRQAAGTPAGGLVSPRVEEPPATIPGGRRPGFRLQLLGQAIVRKIDARGEEREVEWRLRRALQSVAYLALAPDHRATKEQLIDAVWRDSSPGAIAKNFHPTLSGARRALGHRQAFVYSQGTYTLNPELGWWIDCERFTEQIEDGRRLSAGSGSELRWALEAWLAAWRLYRGELLSGLEADWIRDQRAVMRRAYVELMRDLGGLCVRLDRVTQALDAYRSLLLEEPYEERVHLAVMELYARQGRRDLVRRQFVRMQELLLEELNVEPAVESRERYHQLMR